MLYSYPQDSALKSDISLSFYYQTLLYSDLSQARVDRFVRTFTDGIQFSDYVDYAGRKRPSFPVPNFITAVNWILWSARWIPPSQDDQFSRSLGGGACPSFLICFISPSLGNACQLCGQYARLQPERQNAPAKA
jgi:hypothetical protein